MSLAIGSWIRRANGNWHLVESVIADAAITHCGRRLKPRPSDENVVPEGMFVADRICKRCA